MSPHATPPQRDVHVTITARSMVMAILFVLLVGLVWVLRDIVLIVLSAVVIASAMEPGVNFFYKRGIPRIGGVSIIYAIVIGIFFSVIFFFIPPILNDASTFLRQLPQTLQSININDLTHGLLPGFGAGSSLNSADLLSSISQTVSDSTGGMFSTAAAFFGGLTSFVLIVVLSFYFSVQETGVDDFLRLVTPVKEQAYVLHLWKRSQDKIGEWMQGQLVLGIIVGVLLYLGLLILGVRYALLLAVLAALFELIPVFGQIMAAIPAVAIAYTDGGLTIGVYVFILYMVVQQFEAHLIYPIVVKKVVGVPPLLVILSLLIGFKLVGFLGVLLSVPIAGAIQEFVSDIDREKTRALARAGLAPDGEEK
jgi:predicted PurR-regulated permease PerM